MKQDQVYKKLISKMEEVSVVPTQNLGPLTLYYKRFIPFLKNNPLPIFILGAIGASLFFYFLFGPSIVKLVSLFQFGF